MEFTILDKIVVILGQMIVILFLAGIYFVYIWKRRIIPEIITPNSLVGSFILLLLTFLLLVVNSIGISLEWQPYRYVIKHTNLPKLIECAGLTLAFLAYFYGKRLASIEKQIVDMAERHEMSSLKLASFAWLISKDPNYSDAGPQSPLYLLTVPIASLFAPSYIYGFSWETGTFGQYCGLYLASCHVLMGMLSPFTIVFVYFGLYYCIYRVFSLLSRKGFLAGIGLVLAVYSFIMPRIYN